jgi:uncharacterized protein YecE (DUF72 family)
VIHIGTSGFSYDDWVGPVYPDGLPRREQLAFYARKFTTVELNVTFYRVPERRTVEGWVLKTPPKFLFSVKAFRGLTHEREKPDYAPFAMSLRPLAAAGKLGCVLAQFPNSFGVSAKNREYLSGLRHGLGEFPVVLEFRNSVGLTLGSVVLTSHDCPGSCHRWPWRQVPWVMFAFMGETAQSGTTTRSHGSVTTTPTR